MGPTGKMSRDTLRTSMFRSDDNRIWPSDLRYTGQVPVGFDEETLLFGWNRSKLLAARVIKI